MHTQNRPRQRAKRTPGFTLIELIVTVLIVGVIFAAGIPGLNALLGNVSQNASAEKLLNSLAYTRGEAVARAENISIITLPAPAVGWNVFVDTNGDCVQAGTEEVLRQVDITADDVTIGSGCVAFNALGERTNGTNSITVDSTTATGSAAVITITATGAARVD